MNAISDISEARSLLSDRAASADGQTTWPADSWAGLVRAGVTRWCIPKNHGGLDLDAVDLLVGYEQLAEACLTTCFILSQREAACRRICDGDNEALRCDLLPALARGEAFATVGISQLTTSRQHGKLALAAREQDGGFLLEGYMPWVTGAPRTDHFVAGAVLEDGRQILVILPRRLDGVEVGPPLELMALRGSLTAEVRCKGVQLERRWLLAGPAEKVLAGKRGAGGLETSALALGLTGAAVAQLQHEAGTRSELRTIADRLEETHRHLRSDLHQLAREDAPADRAFLLRARVNSLVLSATQAALTASKGAGFLIDHPAQRWARQALFFLVWSCPRPATDAMLAQLTPPECDPFN